MFNMDVLPNNAGCRLTRRLNAPVAIWGVLLLGLATPAVPAESFPVLIRVDAAKSQGDLKAIWRFFGADGPNYAYMQHGRKLVGELGALAPDQVYFRAHNLLNTGNGTPALKWGSTWAWVSRGLRVRAGRRRSMPARTGGVSSANALPGPDPTGWV